MGAEALAEVVDASLLCDVFGLACEFVPDPVSGTPLILREVATTPEGAAERAAGPGPFGTARGVPTAPRTVVTAPVPHPAEG